MSTESGGGGREGATPLVIGHRGASAAHPENTLVAFAGAAALGADWVELDVRRTADGELVVHHDATLPDGRVIVETSSGDLPPTVAALAAALAVCAAHDLGVNIEIKSDPTEPDFDDTYVVAERVAETLAAMPATRSDGSARYLVTSFDPGCVAQVREVAPALPTGQLAFDLRDPAALIAAAAAAGHVAVNPWAPFVDAAFVAAARAAGLRVYPWTVDDPDHLRVLIGLRVDGIITNVPDVLRSLLQTGDRQTL